jgi:endonuclease G
MKVGREDMFRQITADDHLWSEILARAAVPEGGLEGMEIELPGGPAAPPRPEWMPGPVSVDVLEGLKETPSDVLSPENWGLEAIVRRLGRPVLKIQNDDFDPTEADTEFWRERLQQQRDILRAVILSVGRVELKNNPSYAWVGTGWVVAEDVIVTNRHVASEFARKKDDLFVFRQSPMDERTMEARLDFHEEYQGGGPAEFQIVEVLHIEDDGGPDVAFLRIDWSSNPAGGVRACIPLASTVAKDQWVAVIGYPAKDTRTQISDEMDRIFGNIYDVKRLAPGQVMQVSGGRDLFAHDCTTLGGNSGSVVCDLETGQAVGLHFSGREEYANYAVSAPIVKARLESILGKGAAPPERAPAVVVEEAAPTIASLKAKRGYDPDFLGQPVPLPGLPPELRQQVAPVAGRADGLLHYTHYSVLMHATRRLAIYAVCNIDGLQWRKVPRGTDHWYFDPRLARAYQVGEELYKSNKLDQGHLVRRVDPAWGKTFKAAKSATLETFFYTNCAPQHQELNRDLWLGLEEYILGNTDVNDLKVTVFNGPVFRDTDRTYRGVKIPENFWKVVVMVRGDSGKLSVTAYMLSQLDFMDDLEFVFGPYQTYQVPVQQIEKLTGLDFGDLKTYDPLAEREARPFVSLGSLAEIVI